MNNQTSFILKVLIVSASIAAAIKFIAPSLAIPATPTVVLIAVLSPSLILAIVLTWRAWQS